MMPSRPDPTTDHGDDVPPVAVRSTTRTVLAAPSRPSSRIAALGVLLLTVTTVCVFVTLSPRPIPDEVVSALTQATGGAQGLDWSWMIGIGEALRQGKRFGTDITFTFGPYASLFTRVDAPEHDGQMLVAGLALAASYAMASAIVARDAGRYFLPALVIVLAGFVEARDVLLLSSPLVMVLAIVETTEVGPESFSRRWPTLVLLMAPLGLLPLIKGSSIASCAVAVLTCTAYLLWRRRPIDALLAMVVPAIALVSWWTAAGQRPEQIDAYFAAMLPIVTGYTEAMAIADPGGGAVYLQFGIFLFGSACILTGLLRASGRPPAARALLIVTVAVFLFLSFKTAFVRHDGHAITAGNALLVAALVTLPRSDGRALRLVVAMAATFCIYLNVRYLEQPPWAVFGNVANTYGSAWTGLRHRLGDGRWPQDAAAAQQANLGQLLGLPRLPGTVDVYSTGQLALIASSNEWSPRPTFQSYSAYTPALLERNAAHLRGSRAPDWILFAVEPLDGRLPATEDGASWPLLLNNYRPVGMQRDHLLLRRVASPDVAPIKPIATVGARLNDEIVLPGSTKPLWMRTDLHLTRAGQVASLLYKPGPLRIRLVLSDGSERIFRLVSGMARTDFLVSPLVEDTAEFTALALDARGLASKTVRSIRIEPANVATTWQWEPGFLVVFGTR